MLPASMLKPGIQAQYPNQIRYGTSCSLWDQLPGTYFFNSTCGNKSVSLCTQSWCQGTWCFVDPSCPSAKKVSSAWAVEGTTTYFSYEACGSVDCWMGTKGCPYDPEGHCPSDACACKYQGGQIPSDWYVGGTGASMSMMPYYGTSCSKWDLMPGTPFYDSSCDATAGKDLCKNSWCVAAWCFVDAACHSAVSTHKPPGWSNLAKNITVYFSYTTCGATDCYLGTAGCPYDDPRDDVVCGTTCGDMKKYYKDHECCGMPQKAVPRPM